MNKQEALNVKSCVSAGKIYSVMKDESRTQIEIIFMRRDPKKRKEVKKTMRFRIVYKHKRGRIVYYNTESES